MRRALDSPWPYFVGAGLLLLVAIATQFEVRLPSRSVGGLAELRQLRERGDVNVVFLLVDTLRADRLGLYGYERPTSATLDALGRSGVVFTRALSQSSWTKTSMASLWTATHPMNNGIVRYGDVLPGEAVLPAEIFRDAGYVTAGIWRNGWVAPNFGFAQGFDYYFNPRPGRDRVRVQRQNPSSHPLRGTDEDIVSSALEFLESFGRERFFLYLHFMDLHQYVYDDQSAHFGTSYSDVYDQAIDWTDRLIGALLRRLEEIGVMNRTVVVVASDHGEAFREHGFEGHARNLYGEVIHVPMILGLPFRFDPGLRIDRLVSNADLWPTILDLLGLPQLGDVDGRSLSPLIAEAAGGEPDPGRGRPVLGHIDRRWGQPKATSDPLIAVTRGDLRLFLPMVRPDGAELYDLAADPGEKVDLAASRPEELAQLRQLAVDYYENAASPWGVAPHKVELDEMRLNQLRALGYHVGN